MAGSKSIGLPLRDPNQFAVELSRCTLSDEQRVASATAVSKFRAAQRAGIDSIACVETALRNGGVALELSDWLTLAEVLNPMLSHQTMCDLWTTERMVIEAKGAA